MAQPLFLLGLHRGGSTYAQRLLNCHPQVVIWGENAGLVSRLRLLHDSYARRARRLDVETYLDFTAFAEDFIPWASPVDGLALDHQLARFVERMYRPDPAAVAWGFKEIRNSNLRDIAFLHRLFPGGRMVLLTRDPYQRLRSELRVKWSPAQRAPTLEAYAARFAEGYVRALAAFGTAQERWPGNVLVCRYEDLHGGLLLEDLFSWIGVTTDLIDHDLVAKVRAARAGSSFAGAGRDVPLEDEHLVVRRSRDRMAQVLDAPRFARAHALIDFLYPDWRGEQDVS